ncbi:MAG: MerR family transcriptional regulator, partial [Hyphomicrobiales bacterium]|nr:MerR family transcriptional regulator [Hyphomicrobiales bacterium]
MTDNHDTKSGNPAFDQDPHGHAEEDGRLLEKSIGREVRGAREKLGITISELAKSSRISAG